MSNRNGPRRLSHLEIGAVAQVAVALAAGRPRCHAARGRLSWPRFRPAARRGRSQRHAAVARFHAATVPSWPTAIIRRGRAGDRARAIVVHGSSGSSIAIHALARAIAARGVETFAVDIRGHGASGTRGDIAYLGQLEDDLADLVASPQDRPTAR